MPKCFVLRLVLEPFGAPRVLKIVKKCRTVGPNQVLMLKTVKLSTILHILLKKHCACQQKYVCEFLAPKKVSKTVGLLCHFTFYVHFGLVFDNFQGVKTSKNH